VPELPEVQTMVDDLNEAGLPGAVITKALVFWPRTIAHRTPHDFRQQIQGRKIIRLYRRAKFMIFVLDGGLSLIVHLRMTGRFMFRTGEDDPGRHVHVVLCLDDQRRLMFYDTRKFGRFYLTAAPDTLLADLGPEPLDPKFSAKALADRLKGRRGRIKPLLLDQRFVAGMGNIYTDEALWRAHIHPLCPANALTRGEISALHRAIRFVLRQGLRNGGTTLGMGEGNFQSARRGRGRNAAQLNVFRRTGSPCPRCRRPIEKMMVGQRSTHFCGICQRVNGVR
jgi:formamidopyrimidine-DNA glycosylase